MHVTERVHDPEHGIVGVATFVGFILFTESMRGEGGTSKSTSIQTDGNTLYDLHLPESLGRLANKCKYLHIFGNPLQKPPLAVAEQGILHAIAKYLKEIKD